MCEKLCKKCNTIKPCSSFYRDKRAKDGLYSSCKTCSLKIQEVYLIKNGKLYNKPKKEKIIRTEEERKAYMKEYQRNYHIKKKKEPRGKLLHSIRASIFKSFSRKLKRKKHKRTQEILGCSWEFFQGYIEAKFEPWMSWENYGLYNGELNFGWDLDHIIPTSTAITPEDIVKLNHYTNFQPLCSFTNRYIKRHRIL